MEVVFRGGVHVDRVSHRALHAGEDRGFRALDLRLGEYALDGGEAVGLEFHDVAVEAEFVNGAEYALEGLRLRWDRLDFRHGSYLGRLKGKASLPKTACGGKQAPSFTG